MECDELFKHPSQEKEQPLTPFQQEYLSMLKSKCNGFTIATTGPVEFGSYSVGGTEVHDQLGQKPKAKLPNSAIGVRLRFR